MSRQAQFHDLSEMFDKCFKLKNIWVKGGLNDKVNEYVKEANIPLGDIIYCGEEIFKIVGPDMCYGAELGCECALDLQVRKALQEQQIKYDDILEMMKDEDWFFLFYWNEKDAPEQVAEDYRKYGLINLFH